MKTQTVIIHPNGGVVQKIDNFLYKPLKELIIKDKIWRIARITDNLDCENSLIRKIYLSS